MAKAGVQAMTQSLAVEWGGKGIRTVAIAPGWFPTPGASQRLRPAGATRALGDEIPLGRAGEHSELANLASFLVSDFAGYINGATITIDGGRQFLSDGGSGTADLLKWSPEDWARMREQARGSKA
jgi:NAD(P)-dependent dehydrogenase (short-subunit alcohol dehydrogenase family)